MSDPRCFKLFGRGLVLLLLLVSVASSATAKNGGQKKSVRNSRAATTYAGSVCNKDEKPVRDVDIAVEEGRTNADGVFVTKQPYGTTYAIVCEGHSIYWGTLRADTHNICRLGDGAQKPPYGFRNPHVVVNGRYINGCNLNNYAPEQVTVQFSTDSPFGMRVGNIMKRYAITARSVMKRGVAFVVFNEKTHFVSPNRKGTYTIRVTDADGNPIEGAHICIHRTYTDKNGCYSVKASAGDMMVVGKKKYFSQCRELGEAETGNIAIERNNNRNDAENGVEPENDNAVTKAAVMPKFRNGNLSTFRNWVAYNQKMPKTSRLRLPPNAGLETQIHTYLSNSVGMRYTPPSSHVRVQFVIDYDGTLTDIKVLKSNNADIARSIVETLKASPKWAPGRDANGENVRVRYRMTWRFIKDYAESYDQQRAKRMESESWGEN